MVTVSVPTTTCCYTLCSLAMSTEARTTQEETQRDDETTCEHTNSGITGDFWSRHFGDKTEVPWCDFEQAFLDDYKETIEQDFGDDKVNFLVKVLQKDIFERREVISKLYYNKFVGKIKDEKQDQFYDRLRHYASSSLALREVLNMESTVRLTTISNLGVYKYAYPIQPTTVHV